MGNPNPGHVAMRRLSPSEWIARREESIKRIAVLLAEQRLTIQEIAEQAGLARETARGHLMYMETQGLAHRTGRLATMNREYWAAGEAPESVKRGGEGMLAAPVHVVVRRHWMDEALFGPAQGVAA